jgi:hypothetical protein
VESFPYVDLGNNIPAAPIVQVTVTPPDWLPNQDSSSLLALLKTGSDATLIPLELVSVLRLEIIQILNQCCVEFDGLNTQFTIKRVAP